MIKHGNISIEKAELKSGKIYYRLIYHYKTTGSKEIFASLYPEELHSLELCLHKLRGLEFTD
jgi:hypothetical protein